MDPDPSPVVAPLHPAVNLALGWAGAAAGGLVGYFAYGWVVRQGFEALVLPGALLGIGAGLLAKRRSLILTLSCGLAALCLGVFAEWKHFPFIKNDSFGYFVSHLGDLRPVTLLMMVLGGVAGAWFAWRTRG